MSRRQAREVALQALFQLELNKAGEAGETEEYRGSAVDAALHESKPMEDDDREYARALVRGTREHLEELDAHIAEHLHDWKVGRMAGIDRNIARLAVYELQYGGEALTPNIIINEAVELAKKFGSDESGRFINGILGAMVK